MAVNLQAESKQSAVAIIKDCRNTHGPEQLIAVRNVTGVVLSNLGQGILVGIEHQLNCTGSSPLPNETGNG